MARVPTVGVPPFRRLLRVCLLAGCSALAAHSPRAFGATPVVAWQAEFAAAEPASGGSPQAVRQLADGSIMVVTGDGTGMAAHRFTTDGSPLSAAAFYPIQYPKRVLIGPFGEVVVGGITVQCGGCTGGNLFLMKYDGYSGRGLWPAPVLLGSGSFNGNTPFEVVLDGFGDVAAEVHDVPFGSGDLLVRKYDGASGQQIWAASIERPGLIGGMATDPAGNVVVTTAELNVNDNTTKIETIKYDGVSGEILWGPVIHDGGPHDYARHVLADESGVYVAGEGEEADGYGTTLLKYHGATGARAWGPKRYVNPVPGSATYPVQLAIDGFNGLVLLTATSGLPGPSGEFGLLRFSASSGAPVWGPVATGVVNPFYSPHLSIAGNGDVIVDQGVFVDPDFSIRTWRYRRATGDLAWGPMIDMPAFPGGTALTSDGLIAIAYVSAESPNGRFLRARSAATGGTAWTTPPIAGLADKPTRAKAAVATPDGNVVVLGETITALDEDIVVAKYDRMSGAALWGPLVQADAGLVTSFQGATDSAGDVLVFASDSTVLKYEGLSGFVMWGPTDVPGAPAGFAVDSSGNAALVTTVRNGVTHDFATFRVSGMSGSVLWGPVYFDGGATLDDEAKGVAVDGAGNVFVAGLADAGSGARATMLAYSAADGSVLWGPVVESTISQPEVVVSTDAAGDVFLAGASVAQIRVVKYDGQTGSKLWGPAIVVGSGGPGNRARDLVADSNGDLLVTGTLVNSGGQVEYATVKFDGSNGSVLWGPKLVAGGGADPSGGRFIALDGSGNAVVNVRAQGANGLREIATLKYDNASGILLWGPSSTSTGADQDLAGFAVSGDTVFVGTTGLHGMLTTAYTELLGIATVPSAVPNASCGQAYDFVFAASNGAPGYAWSVTSGALPSGMDLDPSGVLSGTPTEQGLFVFRLEVEDSGLATASREFTVLVGDAPGPVSVLVSASKTSECAWVLSVGGGYAGYQWLPDGETQPTIEVLPYEPTTYGVVLTDAQGCFVHAAVTLPGPRCLGPSLVAVAPASGPAAGGSAVTLHGENFEPGSVFSIGGAPGSGVSVESPGEITGLAPALPAGQIHDVVVTGPDGLEDVLPGAYLSDFGDVPESNLFHDDIVRITLAGITAGCGTGVYCPGSSVTRAQMAVFLLKGLLGATYLPPTETGTVFEDVPIGSFAASWIEDLFGRSITGGCSVGPSLYCPGNAVTRAQMAVFLLKAKHSSAYVPPPCAGVFGDVACPGGFAVDWIEELAAEGITAGCGGGNYCPGQPNTRGQMAVFLVRTFELP